MLEIKPLERESDHDLAQCINIALSDMNGLEA
jgi:hypothetical protein